MFRATVFVTCALVLAFTALTFGQRADKNSTIKTAALGDHPYMGYVYFPDESINHISFYRAAVLVSPQHLITAAIFADENSKISFPKNTLIARVGAVVLKAENGDTSDDEETDQEKEVIQVIRPKDYTLVKGWMGDITVVKVVEKFKISPYVNVTSLNPAPRFHADEICSILVYVKIDEMKEEWRLQKRDLKMMGPSGCIKTIKPFNKDRMLCANELNDKNLPVSNEGSCKMHAGGPLLCESELVGIQTYILSTHCTSPYAFQSITFWNDFIKCGLQGKCEDECEDTCTSIGKDENETTPTESIPTKSGQKATTKIQGNTITTTAPSAFKMHEPTSTASRITIEDASSLLNNENNETDKKSLVNLAAQEIKNDDNSSILVNAPILNDSDALVPEAKKYIPIGVLRKSSAEVNANVCVSLILFCLHLFI